MGKAYEKLYSVLCEGCRKEDDELLKRLTQLQDISGEQLSLRAEFCCPLPAAVSLFVARSSENEVQNINQKVKINGKETLNTIAKEISLPLISLIIFRDCKSNHQG